MKLFVCTRSKVQKSRLKRAKRLAFAAALVGLTTTPALAQTTLPELPKFPAIPLEQADGTPESAATKAVHRTRVQSQLLDMLGLGTPTRANQCGPVASQAKVECASSEESCKASPNLVLPAAPMLANVTNPSASAVVTAAATSPAKPSEKEESSSGESLIDIAIPLPGLGSTTDETQPPAPIMSPNQLGAGAPIVAAPVVTPEQLQKPKPVQKPVPAIAAPPVSFPTLPPAAAPQSSVAKATKKSEPAAEKPASKKPVDQKTVVRQAPVALPIVAVAKEPALVEAPRTVDVGETSFSLSDSTDSKSDTAKPAVASSNRSRPMRVRIEGEARPIAVQVMKRSSVAPRIRAVPAPTFETPAVKPAVKTTTVAAAPAQTKAKPVADKAVASAGASVSSSPEPRVTPAAAIMAIKNQKSGTPLTVAEHGTTAVASTSAILEYSSEHPTICRLIKTGEKSLTVVGLASGTTRVAVVTHDAAGKKQVEIRQVTVGSRNDEVATLPDLARDISATVAGLYPGSRVEIVAQDSSLIVQGTVPNESDARRILSLIRKTSLAPVIDRLQAGGRR